jgi:hypothetical protein
MPFHQYWYAGDGFKYWRMNEDVNESRVINRAKAEPYWPIPLSKITTEETDIGRSDDNHGSCDKNPRNPMTLEIS